jgi:hypothetical protein
MKNRLGPKNIYFSTLLLILLLLSSCEKHEYCAECWEDKPLINLGRAGDVSFCSDDLVLIDEFIADYEYSGWECKLKD